MYMFSEMHLRNSYSVLLKGNNMLKQSIKWYHKMKFMNYGFLSENANFEKQKYINFPFKIIYNIGTCKKLLCVLDKILEKFASSVLIRICINFIWDIFCLQNSRNLEYEKENLCRRENACVWRQLECDNTIFF